MKIEKKQIELALSQIKMPEGNITIWESGVVKNIQVFSDEVELDVEIKNPTLQYKKRVEVDCIKIIHEKVFQKAKVKVNFKILPSEMKPNQIRGKETMSI